MDGATELTKEHKKKELGNLRLIGSAPMETARLLVNWAPYSCGDSFAAISLSLNPLFK